MKIVILGAGQVGSSLAGSLSAEHHDVTLVDTDLERLQTLQEKYDIRTVQGCCSYPDVLRKAGTQEADMLIAVTSDDESNMVACQVAYSLFHTPLKIARIRAAQYFERKDLFGQENMPIDVFISPERLVTKEICQLIMHPGALQVLDFADGKIKLVAVKPYYGGPLLGKSVGQLKDIFPKTDVRIVAIFRHDALVPVNASTVIEIGDEVFFVTATENVYAIMSGLRRLEEPYKRIMIAGGGNIGLSLAEALQTQYQVKLIEKSHKVCEHLARQLDNVIVLHGEASDKPLLLNENIENIDVFCAVTEDDEDNIIAALQAKRLGAKQVMSLISYESYVDLIEGGQINIAISPYMATVSAILTHIRRGDITHVHALRRGLAEAIEIVAHGDVKTSKVVGRPLSKIKFPRDTTVGAILRKGRVMMPTADLTIEAEDHLVLFIADKQQLKALEKLFQVSAGFF